MPSTAQPTEVTPRLFGRNLGCCCTRIRAFSCSANRMPRTWAAGSCWCGSTGERQRGHAVSAFLQSTWISSSRWCGRRTAAIRAQIRQLRR